MTLEALAAEGSPTAHRLRLPVWLMGLTSASFGMFGGILAVTTPQLLASVGAPESRIAAVTGLAMIPGACAFLFSPLLDIGLKRRDWAVLLAVAAALQLVGALLSLRQIGLFSILMFGGFLCAVLGTAAAGGWLGSLISIPERNRLGAWNTVGNIGGGGVAIMIAIPLLRSLPFQVGAVVLALLTLIPLAPFAFLPAPPPDARLSHERFTAFARDIGALLSQRRILGLLVVFFAPAAAFALTNTLGGLGAQFHADERFVSLTAGVGVLAAGIVGSLLVPPLLDRLPPIWLYLMIGALGAAFTALLILLPKTPAVFALAMMGENTFQAAGFSAVLAIAYRSLGDNNPLAATQVALLTGVSNAPIIYMQFIDGQAFGRGGLTATLAADAVLSFLVCAGLSLALWSLNARPPTGAKSEV